jgi:hypothetical protein
MSNKLIQSLTPTAGHMHTKRSSRKRNTDFRNLSTPFESLKIRPFPSHTLIQASHWNIEIYTNTGNSNRFGTSQELMSLDA